MGTQGGNTFFSTYVRTNVTALPMLSAKKFIKKNGNIGNAVTSHFVQLCGSRYRVTDVTVFFRVAAYLRSVAKMGTLSAD